MHLGHVKQRNALSPSLDDAVGDGDGVDAVAVLALVVAAHAARMVRYVVLYEQELEVRHDGLIKQAITRAQHRLPWPRPSNLSR